MPGDFLIMRGILYSDVIVASDFLSKPCGKYYTRNADINTIDINVEMRQERPGHEIRFEINLMTSSSGHLKSMESKLII